MTLRIEWHSLELRVPLVDHQLIELCAVMPVHYKIRLFGGMKVLLKKDCQALPATKHHRSSQAGL